MVSVTQRIKDIKKINSAKQPRGGYIPPKTFNRRCFDDGIELSLNENIHPSLIGIVVDYLTRFCQGDDKAFVSPMNGALVVKVLEYASELRSEIHGLDEESIFNACRLCGYESVARAGKHTYVPVQTINPDDATIQNIKTMVARSLHFFEEYGPVNQERISFEGGYTDIITNGDADYLTPHALWEMKVLKSSPTTDHTLQLLIYYLMGCRSRLKDRFDGLSKLGIFNPRLNTMYILDIDLIDLETIEDVSKHVIGYSS